MTDLENKVLDKILEKINIEELIEKIGYDKLTDKIAEKAAEFIMKKEYPDTSTEQPFIPNPWINPSPWKTEPYPITPVTVMYGVTPTEFKPTAFETAIQNLLKESEDSITDDATKKE